MKAAAWVADAAGDGNRVAALCTTEAAMDSWCHGIIAAFQKEAAALFDPAEAVQAALRLLVAIAAGGVIGMERQWTRKSAGMRTHMLVSMGAALSVLSGLAAGMTPEHVSRIMQGVVAGVGFIGGGVILKHVEKDEVHGLTTAAGLWMTAALGMAAGLGRYASVLLATALAWLVLGVVRRWEAAEDAIKH
jgi:putative Mg2+ transporter-C (MgtC) family protein